MDKQNNQLVNEYPFYMAELHILFVLNLFITALPWFPAPSPTL